MSIPARIISSSSSESSITIPTNNQSYNQANNQPFSQTNHQPNYQAYNQSYNQSYNHANNHANTRITTNLDQVINFTNLDWCSQTMDNLVVQNNHNMANLTCYFKGELMGIKHRLNTYLRDKVVINQSEFGNLNIALRNKTEFARQLETRYNNLIQENITLQQRQSTDASRIEELNRLLANQGREIERLQGKVKQYEDHYDGLINTADRIANNMK